jgi:Flp pilus assembly protein TadD
MAAQAVEGDASPALARRAPAPGSRGAAARSRARCSPAARCRAGCSKDDGRWRRSGCVLGLALLGACAGDPAPGPLLVGGRLSAGFTELAREELQADFRLAPTLPSLALAPGSLRAPPVPALRPRLAVVLPPPPAPRREPVAHERIAWIPQPKPERRPVGPRTAIWPPPWKPDPADLSLAVEPAAGPPADPPRALWPPPWKPDPADLPLAAGPAEEPPGSDGSVRIVVAHGRAASLAIGHGIAVSELDELLPQLERAAREALLAGDPATALAIYERLRARFPEERAIWLGQAIALERLGRGSEAQALYQAMLGADPEDLGAKIALLGIVAELAPDEALRLLRRLAHHHPDDARLRAQIALVLARQGALPAAIAEQRRALTLAPANLGYRINLAVLYDRAGGIDAAVEHYRSALELATLGGAPTAQLDAIAARLHHLRARQRPAAPSATR